MSEILLVNPRRRRKARKTHARKRRSRARAPRVTRRRRRRAVAAFTAAPRRRSRRRHSVAIKRMRRRKHNPSFRSLTSGAVPMLKSGLIGATGALGLDLLWGYGSQYLPASIAGSAIAQYAVKLAGALAVGIVGDKLLRGKGKEMAVGATTVVLHDALKAQLKASFPSLSLGEYLTYAPTVGVMNRAGRVMSTGMGEYLSGLPNETNNVTNAYNGGEYSADGISGY